MKEYKFTVTIFAESAEEAWAQVSLGKPDFAGRIYHAMLHEADKLVYHMPMEQQKAWEEATGKTTLEALRSESKLAMSRAKLIECWSKNGTERRNDV